jgi:hypothetical protein
MVATRYAAVLDDFPLQAHYRVHLLICIWCDAIQRCARAHQVEMVIGRQEDAGIKRQARAQCDGFIDMGDEKMAATFLIQDWCHSYRAKAIGIGLEYRRAGGIADAAAQ